MTSRRGGWCGAAGQRAPSKLVVVFKRLANMEPRTEKRMHYILAAVWFVVAFPIMLTPALRESIALLVFISVYANVAGHWSAAQAAQGEERADDA